MDMREYLIKFLRDLMLTSVKKRGQSLYDDYNELQPGAAKRLEELHNRPPGGTDTLPTRRGRALFTTMAGFIPTMLTKLRHILSVKDQGLPLQQQPPTAGTQHTATPQPQLARALFLLICHNVSTYDRKLLQLSVHDIQSDETFFGLSKSTIDQSVTTGGLSYPSEP